MADRWLVRVGEKEYGPVDLGTLGDWKREGRLLPTNEVRRESDSVWTTANTIPELFRPPPLMSWKDVKYAWANCSGGRPIFFPGLPGSASLFTEVIFFVPPSRSRLS